MARRKPIHAKGPLAGRPEIVSLFDRLIQYCGGDEKTALVELGREADIDDRTLHKIKHPKRGKERWHESTDERVRNALAVLIERHKSTAEQSARNKRKKAEYHGAPNSVERWVARDDGTSRMLDTCRDGETYRIVQLVADGGEGKSALVRMWLDSLVQKPPAGVFWWNFYYNRRVDALLSALLGFLPANPSEGPPSQLPSEQAARAARRLSENNYIIVFDGFEKMLDSHPQDVLAPVEAGELRAFLWEFARHGSRSMCVLTTRVGVVDLENERNCLRHRVPPLGDRAAAELLAVLGVTGPQEHLAAAAKECCGGHALAVVLLGTYLARHCGGDVTKATGLGLPDPKSSDSERVGRLLSLHNEETTDGRRGRELMTLISAIRKPINEHITVELVSEMAAHPAFSAMFPATEQPSGFQSTLDRLISDKLINRSHDAKELMLHELVRSYYQDKLHQHPLEIRDTWHRKIRDRFLKTPPVPDPIDPAQLDPFVEAVYHGCQSGDYDDAWTLTLQHISQGERFLLALGLGQWRTSFALLSDFFPANDLDRLPLVTDRGQQAYMMALAGFAQLPLGQFVEGGALMQRAANVAATHNIPGVAAFAFCNLAEYHILRGELFLARLAADRALSLAEMQQDENGMRRSWVYQMWTCYLRGEREEMGRVLEVGRGRFPDFPSVHDVHGVGRVLEGLFLRWIGRSSEATKVLTSSSKSCEANHYWNQASRCQRILGQRGGKTAKNQLISAVELAKRASFQPSLLEAQAALGGWYADHDDLDLAWIHIQGALEDASRNNLLLHSIDAKLAHVVLLRKQGFASEASSKLKEARRDSELLGYYWGVENAKSIT